MPRKMRIEAYQEKINSKMSIDEIKAEYEKLKNNPKADKERIEVLETALYECFAREEIPQQYAWKLLQGSKMPAFIIGEMPNKKFRKILIRAKLFGAEIKILGYVEIRSPRAERYQKGAAIYVSLQQDFGKCLHEIEEEKFNC